MAYVSAAVYDAVVAIEGRYVPYSRCRNGARSINGRGGHRGSDRTLVHYFPGQTSILEPQITPRSTASRTGSRRRRASSWARAQRISSSASARTTDA